MYSYQTFFFFFHFPHFFSYWKCTCNLGFSVPLQPFFQQTSPEHAQKSQPAHCPSAVPDISEWLALLWVDRDLRVRKKHLSLTQTNTPYHTLIYSWMNPERMWIHLLSAHRACAIYAWDSFHTAGWGFCCSVRPPLWRRPASGWASPHPPDTNHILNSVRLKTHTYTHSRMCCVTHQRLTGTLEHIADILTLPRLWLVSADEPKMVGLPDSLCESQEKQEVRNSSQGMCVLMTFYILCCLLLNLFLPK